MQIVLASNVPILRLQIHFLSQQRQYIVYWNLRNPLNCIWWWGSSPEALGNVEYPFIAITSRSTLIQDGST